MCSLSIGKNNRAIIAQKMRPVKTESFYFEGQRCHDKIKKNSIQPSIDTSPAQFSNQSTVYQITRSERQVEAPFSANVKKQTPF